MTPQAGRRAGLGEVVRFIIGTLTTWAAHRTYGKLTITVQAGQIAFVAVDQSYTTETLPVPQGADLPGL